MSQSRPRTLRSMLQPAIDHALYAPVIWLCLFAVGASWLVAQHRISQTLVDRVLLGGYTFAVAIAGVLPLLRALKATFTFTPAVTTVERSTARMLRRILKGEAISEDLSYLREIASEGNLDTDHFQARAFTLARSPLRSRLVVGRRSPRPSGANAGN